MNLLQETEGLLEFLDSNEDEFQDETEIEDLRHKLDQLQLELEQLFVSDKRQGEQRRFIEKQNSFFKLTTT